MEGVRIGWLAVLVLAVCGCGSPPESPFPDFLAGVRAEHPASGHGAYSSLAQAAANAEELAGPDLKRVYFTPKKRTDLIERLRGPVEQSIRASASSIEMPERAVEPFETLPCQAGWRMIGRCLIWRAERAIAAGDQAQAVSLVLAATRLGFVLTGGSATDAQLGFHLVDEARRTLAPAIGLLSAGDLRRLGTGIEAALSRRPDVDRVIHNERVSMLKAVQSIQDLYRDKMLGKLSTELGRDIEPVVAALEKLRNEDSEERAQYFKGFAEEADRWLNHFDAAMHMNARQRAKLGQPELAETRPWKRLSKHFFRSLEPLVAMREQSLCRTRLFALQALLLAECKANGSAPATLLGVSKELRMDPYTGADFPYRAEGGRFLLYSVGADLTDDAGETDAASETPDMRLEGDIG
jgi:hypothetical protein